MIQHDTRHPDTLGMARALVEAPSPTGAEGPAIEVAAGLLAEVGLEVVRQDVSAGRANLFAAAGRPRSVLTTHLDTVPGVLPVRVEGDVLHGRGACDAKGIAAAMIAAAARALAAGTTDFGLLFVVGEETTSDGAIAADRLLASAELPWAPERALFGEPTDNRWVSRHPGVVVATLTARGRSAHSSRPDEGVSAVHALLDVLDGVRSDAWPEDPELGPTLLNVGRIAGGTAANVIADAADAHLMLRSGEPTVDLVRRLRGHLAGGVELEVTCASEPVTFACPADAMSGPVAFSTDAPFLGRLGAPALFGPGSIRHAHADDEQVTGAELEAAADTYASWLTSAPRGANA